METLIFELIKGIFLAFGVIVGFLIMSASMVRMINKEDEKYNKEKLIKAFNTFLADLEKNEEYELILECKEIINRLESNETPEKVKSYEIKKDYSLRIKKESFAQVFKFEESYIVIGKKEQLAD